MVQRQSAATTTFAFRGEVTSFVDGLGLLDGSIGVGTPISGSYSFDPDAPDRVPERDDFSSFETPVPPGGITLRAGSATFAPIPGSPFLIQLANDVGIPLLQPPQDTYAVIGANQLAGGDPTRSWTVALNFFDGERFGASPADAIDSDALLVAPPYLGAWDVTLFRIATNVSSFAFFLQGTVDSIAVAPDAAVPEPSAWLTFATGALVVGALARSRRRAPPS